MPFEYIIDAVRGIVFSRGYGLVTDDELRQHAAMLKADPQFKPTFRQFVDFAEVNEVTVTATGLVSISGKANPFGPGAVRSVYAPRDVVFGLSRMFEITHARSNMLVTRDREAAERHVGLAPGESQKVFSEERPRENQA